MDKKSTLTSIDNFVDSLAKSWPNDTNLRVFMLLVKKVVNEEFGSEQETREKMLLDAFDDFYKKNRLDIVSNRFHMVTDKIFISDGINLDIVQYYKDSPDADRTNIAHNVLTIGCLINQDDDSSIEMLEQFLASTKKMNVDTSTPEGKFVNDIMTTTFEGLKDADMNNPMDMFTRVGAKMPELVNGIKNNMESGELDPMRMASAFQSMIGAFTPLVASMSKQAEKPSEESKVTEPAEQGIEPHKGLVDDNGNMNIANMVSAFQNMSTGGGDEDDAVTSGIMASVASTAMDTMKDVITQVSEE